MSTVATLPIDEETREKMRSFYADCLLPNDNPFVDFAAKNENATITVYKKEKNGMVKAVFQGEKAEYEASIWGIPTLPPKQKNTILKKKTSPYPFFEQIGSDEVGTGDFFGPICVAASYVDRKGLSVLQELGVTDSKKMSDEKIRQIGPDLVHGFPYSQLSLPVEKYNELILRGENLNSIKAKMHNRCLLNLSKRFPRAKLCQDQFAEENLYYRYLSREEEVARPILFSTKGELAFPSVALASVIARYSFLLKMDALSKELGKDIPLGAGEEVDAFALGVAKEKGKEALDPYVKKNFKNYTKIPG